MQDDLALLATGDFVPRLVQLGSKSRALRLTDSKVAHGANLWATAFLPDNGQLQARFDAVTADDAGSLIFWDIKVVRKGVFLDSPAHSLSVGTSRISDVAYHPKGCWLGAVSRDGDASLVRTGTAGCDAVDKPELHSILAGPASFDTEKVPLNAIAFSPDGKRLLIGGDAGLLYWMEFRPDDASSPVGDAQLLRGATGPVRNVSFFPNSSDTVAVTAGNVVKLWDLNHGGGPVDLNSEGADLHSLSISADGALIAAGDGRGRVMVWNRRAADEVCQFVYRNLTAQEWQDYVGKIDPNDICPDL